MDATRTAKVGRQQAAYSPEQWLSSLNADQQTLNFIVTGEIRSGASAVASAISNRGSAICHVGLFHRDDAVRSKSHETYFGDSLEEIGDWLVSGITNPTQYISNSIFSRPQHSEKAVGLHLSYGDIRTWDLYDFLDEKWREGDFCVIDVVRNPAICFVSLQQAERFNVWGRSSLEDHPRPPLPVHIPPDELIAFCRQSLAMRAKIKNSCRDRLEITYKQLLNRYQAAMRRAFSFLELPYRADLAVPGYRRLPGRDLLHERVANLKELRAKVPTDIRALLDEDELA